MRRVLAICLDGYEVSLAEDLMSAGCLPAMSRLARDSARFHLDHGAALRTGLAGEHVATGLSPEDAGRHAAVHFDPNTCQAWQEGTSRAPFAAVLPLRTVVFDPPYFDLDAAASVRGIVNWGAHDPGVPAGSRPADLLAEVRQTFGDYPARPWIYGLPWSSPAASRSMGADLTRAVEMRARIARWLLEERLPDWDLALITVSEAHSAIEGLWHGVDASHPLHQAASAPAAGEGVRAVYRAIDALVESLARRFPDAAVVVFSMHGMGPNRSDPASMLLLPELLYRRRFGRPLFARQGSGCTRLRGQVALREGETWRAWVEAGFDDGGCMSRLHRAPAGLTRRLQRAADRCLGRNLPPPHAERRPISWMPASRYTRYWRSMDSFALPSFYDGRVRVNLAGREAWGRVRHSDYLAELDAVTCLVAECRDVVTGEGVIEAVERPCAANPAEAVETDADLVFVWNGAPTGFEHPDLGRIGPVPYRRTGGHTGGFGFAYVRAPGTEAGERGVRSAFDVVPTLVELSRVRVDVPLSGVSLLKTA